MSSLNGLVSYTTSQLLREIENFHNSKALTMYTIANKYTQTNIEYHESMIKHWRSLLPELREMPKKL